MTENNRMTVEEAREILWKEFDPVSDETIEIMLHTFRLIARKIIEDLGNKQIISKDKENIFCQ